jgi:hypothetical protein
MHGHIETTRPTPSAPLENPEVQKHSRISRNTFNDNLKTLTATLKSSQAPATRLWGPSNDDQKVVLKPKIAFNPKQFTDLEILNEETLALIQKRGVRDFSRTDEAHARTTDHLVRFSCGSTLCTNKLRTDHERD